MRAKVGCCNAPLLQRETMAATVECHIPPFPIGCPGCPHSGNRRAISAVIPGLRIVTSASGGTPATSVASGICERGSGNSRPRRQWRAGKRRFALRRTRGLAANCGPPARRRLGALSGAREAPKSSARQTPAASPPPYVTGHGQPADLRTQHSVRGAVPSQKKSNGGRLRAPPSVPRITAWNK